MFRMTKNILANAARKPATRHYPFVQREPFAGVRGELCIEIEKCIFCMTCARKCPSQCITVDAKAGTWTCDPMACVYCSICVEACPAKCLGMKPKHRAPTTERIMMVHQGTPPKKKAKADKAEPGAVETGA